MSNAAFAPSVPVLALVFYQEGGRSTGHQSIQSTTVYKLPVTRTEAGEHLLGAPVPVSEADVQALVESFSHQTLRFLPPDVVAHGTDTLAWFIPAGPRPLIFHAKYPGAESINALSGEMFPQPPLLMLSTRFRLQVFALRENERPGPTAELMVAPYWNTFADGRVCQGSVRFPDRLDPDSIHRWTAVFFQSTFTGSSRGVLSSWGASHEELWRHVQALGHFPAGLLIPEPRLKTLGDLLCTD